MLFNAQPVKDKNEGYGNSLVVHFKGGGFAPSAIEVIQFAECSLSPNAKASNVSTWSKLQQV